MGNCMAGAACEICFETKNPTVCLHLDPKQSRWKNRQKKGHYRTCQRCLMMTLKTAIEEQKSHLRCPCGRDISFDTLQKLLLNGYDRFATEKQQIIAFLQKKKEDEKESRKKVHCPSCDQAVPRRILLTSDKCSSCRTKIPELVEEMKVDAERKKMGFSKCPHCGIMVERTKGCDHMTHYFYGEKHEFYYETGNPYDPNF